MREAGVQRSMPKKIRVGEGRKRWTSVTCRNVGTAIVKGEVILLAEVVKTNHRKGSNVPKNKNQVQIGGGEVGRGKENLHEIDKRLEG